MIFFNCKKCNLYQKEIEILNRKLSTVSNDLFEKINRINIENFQHDQICRNLNNQINLGLDREKVYKKECDNLLSQLIDFKKNYFEKL